MRSATVAALFCAGAGATAVTGQCVDYGPCSCTNGTAPPCAQGNSNCCAASAICDREPKCWVPAGTDQSRNARATCTAVAGSGVSDDWCNQNCNHSPPNCPANLCTCDGPSPPGPNPPSPTPAPGPAPPPAPAPPVPAEVIGYYSWNWGSGSVGPSGANSGCAFTGLSNLQQAIEQYPLSDDPPHSWCCPALKGAKYITLGGGNSAGVLSAASLAPITAGAATIRAAGYDGVMYDVEEVTGPASEAVPAFAASFKAMKAAGLIVAVTTSHSAPYACDTAQDAIDLVKAWVADSNIDILSPQLYSSGSEAAPEFAETSSCKDAGCTWSLWRGAKGKFAPSIVAASQYGAVKEWFASNQQISTAGFFEWQQDK